MIVDITVVQGRTQIGSGSVTLDDAQCEKLGIDVRRIVFKAELAVNTHVPEIRVHAATSPEDGDDPTYEGMPGLAADDSGDTNG